MNVEDTELPVLHATNSTLARELDYRINHLSDRSKHFECHIYCEIGRCAFQMGPQVNANVFDGHEPIASLVILDFFSRACNEPYVHERNALRFLSLFLECSVKAALAH